MRRLILPLTALLLGTTAEAQTFWTEDFGTGCSQGTLASAYSGTNGAWSIAATGTNAAEANTWFVSAMENGNAAGQCGSGCGTDRSLHVGNVAVAILSLPADNGASYNAGGLCGSFFCVGTDRRAESPVINCTGQTGITLAFNYIENGDGTTDDATLWYFDGATWAQIDPLAKPPLGACAPQGTWTAFSIALPASANNNPNVRIGFRWVNNDDGVGTDPSFAVDDITLSVPTTGPTAAFTVSNSNLCVNDCVNFTNTSTGAPFTSVSWTFTGGTPSSSTANNPTNICYNAPGTYDVTLTVTNASGTDTETQTGYITVSTCTPPVASFTASNTNICVNDCISFTNTSTGSPFTLVAWQFQGATPATSTNPAPTNICYSAPGTYDVTLIVQNANGQDTLVMPGYITVTTCGGAPTANFSVSNANPCAGDCINFTDLSTGGATSWSWSFPGGTPASSTAQNPNNICFATAGTYTVTLTATNASGSDPFSMNISVVTCSAPVAGFTTANDTICAGNCITFTNTSTNATSYNWQFPGGIPSSSTSANPGTICFPTSGSYSVSLNVTGPGGNDSYSFALEVLNAPLITGSNDTIITMGDSVMIGAIGTPGGGVYTWFPSSSMNPSNGIGDTVMVGPVESTYYVIQYDDGSVCYGYDTVYVEVIPIELIDVPNAFSPNNDGNNDFLLVYGSLIKAIRFKVYNRYGQMVFSTESTSEGWDGTFNGKQLDPGVFAWVLEYTFMSNKTGVKSGNVTLLR